MKIINPSFEILTPVSKDYVYKFLEEIGRTCYQSHDKTTEGSAENLIRFLIKRGHESVLEHFNITVRIICDRAVHLEWVRHRIASYSAESTRYVNYNKTGEITVIKPCYLAEGTNTYESWHRACSVAEMNYNDMILAGCQPQEARAVLPQSTKVEFICTMNLRSWRHFFKLRTAKDAHPQIRQIAIPLLETLYEQLPIIFEDILFQDSAK